VIVFLIIGQYIDIYEQIVPGTMGEVKIGLVEIGAFMGFAGLFTYIVLRTLSSASLIPEKHPLLKESLHHSGH
jgi:hypothetical protein